MYALNEMICLLQTTKNASSLELNSRDVGDWAQDKILPVLLHDSLHLTQYVERVSKVLQFMIEQNVLTNEDIQMIWNARTGAHPVIVQNVDTLLFRVQTFVSSFFWVETVLHYLRISTSCIPRLV